MEPWHQRLAAGDVHAAWDLFIEAYRPLILATIRNSVESHDAVMDAFAHVCAALSINDLARLQLFYAREEHAAKFTTWLVVVVRNQTIDWVRTQHGRRRTSIPDGMSAVEKHVFELIFVEGCSHVEAYERLSSAALNPPSFSDFLHILHAVYRRRGGAPDRLSPTLERGPEPLVDSAPLPDERLETAEMGERVRHALDTLAPDERLAIQLFIVDGLTAAETAKIVGWPSGKTVYNRVYRALAVLRSCLAPLIPPR